MTYKQIGFLILFVFAVLISILFSGLNIGIAQEALRYGPESYLFAIPDHEVIVYSYAWAITYTMMAMLLLVFYFKG
jgi:hypothetical protein